MFISERKSWRELDLTTVAPKGIRRFGPAANDILFKPHPAMEWPDFKINDELFEVVSVRTRRVLEGGDKQRHDHGSLGRTLYFVLTLPRNWSGKHSTKT